MFKYSHIAVVALIAFKITVRVTSPKSDWPLACLSLKEAKVSTGIAFWVLQTYIPHYLIKEWPFMGIIFLCFHVKHLLILKGL